MAIMEQDFLNFMKLETKKLYRIKEKSLLQFWRIQSRAAAGCEFLSENELFMVLAELSPYSLLSNKVYFKFKIFLIKTCEVITCEIYGPHIEKTVQEL